MDELSRYGRTQRVLELAGLSLFAALIILHLPEVEFSFFHLVLAWLAADLLSGVAHWAFDSFGSLRTPVVGPAFIRPFREHHVDPGAMTRHDFVETNGSSCLACVPLLVIGLFMEGNARAFLVLLCLGILVTNQCHKWAHMDAPPRAIQLLQKARLVLRPEVHRLHHTPPFASHYCTASGWLNPVLDTLLKR
jgi:hypothetical protein